MSLNTSNVLYSGNIKSHEIWVLISNHAGLPDLPFNRQRFFRLSGKFSQPREIFIPNSEERNPISIATFDVQKKIRDRSPIVSSDIVVLPAQSVQNRTAYSDKVRSSTGFWYSLVKHKVGSYEQRTLTFWRDSYFYLLDIQTGRSNYQLYLIVNLHDQPSKIHTGMDQYLDIYFFHEVDSDVITANQQLIEESKLRAAKAKSAGMQRAYKAGAPGLGKNS